MMKYILALTLLAYSLNGQGIPRFLWNPVIKPIEWLPTDPDPDDPAQRSFNDPLNTNTTPFKLTRTETRTRITKLKINNKDVFAQDRWLVHYYESIGRAGLDVKRDIPIETKTMTRTYTDPDGKFVSQTLPNEHSNESSLTSYNYSQKLDDAQHYGTYFVIPGTWETNRDVDRDVVDGTFVNPLQNIVSTRNITAVMQLGDLDYKMRLLNRFPGRYDIIFRTTNGKHIVQ